MVHIFIRTTYSRKIMVENKIKIGIVVNEVSIAIGEKQTSTPQLTFIYINFFEMLETIIKCM